MSNTSFSALPLQPDMLANLDTLGYHEMTPIQAQSLPPILENRDVIAKAKTGSGKTAAFGIGLLHKLNVKQFRIQTIVLCPTRELADQVAKELRRLARGTHNVKILLLSGGMPFGPERLSLEHGAHIIVGTPGRVQDHLGKGTLRLDHVTTLVLDEADRMLDMGFNEAILKIISNIPHKRQTLLFSATFPDNITRLSRDIQQDPLEVSVESTHSAAVIEQLAYETSKQIDHEQLMHLLTHYKSEATIIFCNTKIACQELADELQYDGFSALALHGDLDQRQRTEVLVQFTNRSCTILIATDVASRGLDIDNVAAVINYDLPHDPEVYVHRIGRTGRAGKKGVALTLLRPSDRQRLKAIEAYTGHTLPRSPIDSLKSDETYDYTAPMKTLLIYGGKKDKLRPGDIVGALTGDAQIDSSAIGNIDRFDRFTYVAVETDLAETAANRLHNGKIKGRKFKTHILN